MGYKNDTISGIKWLGSFRIATRIMSFGRTFILARLLTPSQFGVFGIVTLVLAFFEILTETGINIFLIQKKEKIDQYINTAWVTSIARGLIIALIIIVSAPLIASFFSTQEVVNLLYLIAIVPIVRGFINPSVVKFIKDLRFKEEFIFRTSIFFIESIFTLYFVYLGRDLHGLAIGLIAGAMFEVILSFILVKPQPKWEFEKQKLLELLGRGKWLTLTGILNYIYQSGDNAVIGKILGTSQLGLYDMAYKISMLPITEVSDIVSKASFPIYVKISDDKLRFKKAYYKSLVLVSAAVIPIGFIIYFFPREIITLLLGSRWMEAAPVLQVLAVFGVIRAISQTVVAPIYAAQKQEHLTSITIVSVIGLSITIVPFVSMWGIVGAGVSAIIGSIAALPFAVYYLRKILY